MSDASQPVVPHIPDETTLPEITVKAVFLGIALSAILAGANAYLGLFAGMTVSASIPAAVISMAVLRLFRNHNILENNIVQTAASAGESLAAGVIFTIPALVILKHWTSFNYWETTLIAALGGTIGVLFTIPLRRALITNSPLKFPEGVATAEVLKVGESGGSGVKYIVWAGLIGAFFKLGESGFKLWHGMLEMGTKAFGTVLYFGSNLSPALVAVGYIVGLNIAILVFLGGALNWFVVIPILASLEPLATDKTALEIGWNLWSTQTRYLGVGSMVVGGLWALIKLRTSLVDGVRQSISAYRQSKTENSVAIKRTERDTPIQWVGTALLIGVIPLCFLFYYATGNAFVAALMAIVMLIAGFLFSAVAGYMAGLVGSSNNPISGVTIATILTSALLLVALLGTDSAVGPAAAILIGAVVCCGAAIAGDNMQDLKAGQVLGATPFKQQIMQIIGVLAAAFVIAPILTLLMEAYGIGIPTAEHPNPLKAPQATLMAEVARGVFRGGMPWGMVAIGALIAVAVIIFDLWLEKNNSNFRTPVLAVAVGIYLPLELSVPIVLGGLIAWTVQRGRSNSEGAGGHGLLFAAGLITGEALVGILLAIPIVMTGDKEFLAKFYVSHKPALMGLALLLAVSYALLKVAKGDEEKA
jgi:putative OPT family oligopeptide transporter